jgi:hypothetical protein
MQLEDERLFWLPILGSQHNTTYDAFDFVNFSNNVHRDNPQVILDDPRWAAVRECAARDVGAGDFST